MKLRKSILAAALFTVLLAGKAQAECGPGHESECKAPEDPIIIIVDAVRIGLLTAWRLLA